MKFKEMFAKKRFINKSKLDYACERNQEIYNIPLAHQDLVMERFENTREHPESLLDWNDAKELLKKQ